MRQAVEHRLRPKPPTVPAPVPRKEPLPDERLRYLQSFGDRCDGQSLIVDLAAAAVNLERAVRGGVTLTAGQLDRRSGPGGRRTARRRPLSRTDGKFWLGSRRAGLGGLCA